MVLSFWNICSQSSFHVNLADFLSSCMMGWICSASLGRKWEMVVRRPTRRCTFFTLVVLRISMIALHFSGLDSIPRCVSMNPRNLPQSTPNMDLSGFRRRLYCRNAEKTADRSIACW